MNENKKQYLYTAVAVILTLIVGIATLFCIKKYDVHAEGTDDLTGWIMVYSSKGQAITGGEPVEQDIILYMKYSDFDAGSMCLVDNGNGYINWYSTVGTVPGREMRTVAYTEPHAANWKSGNALPSADYTFNAFYIFKTKDDANGYLKGTVPATAATNYDEVQQALQDIEKQMQEFNKTYDGSIPIPDKVYFSSLGASGVTGVWSYNSSTFNDFEYELYYDVKLEHFYSTSSFVEKIFSKEKTTYNNFKKTSDESINELGQVVPQYSVQNYADNHVTGSIYNGLLSDTSDKGIKEINGLMYVTNTITSVPQEFKLNLDFQYLYVGSQLSVTPYYVNEDGEKKYGKTVVSRKFTADDLDAILGSTNTVVATDDSGTQYAESQTKVDSNGNYYDNVLTTDNVTEYVKNGFGLAGSDGYVELSRRFFGGIPPYIWAIIAMALSVNLTVIVFKVLRGM